MEPAHGQPEELEIAPHQRPQRPLTTDEKLQATTFDVESQGSNEYNSPRPTEYNSTPITQDNGILSKLRNFEATMDRKLGIESEAIDRKLPEDRKSQPWHSQLVMALLWASGTMNVSCFATGFLGHEFGLSLKQSILIIIFASILGGSVSGFCATMGAATGLRQISIGRYSMGWYPNKIIALLNTVQQLGWSAVGCITGGLALQAVSNGNVSIAVGIVIIAVCSLGISFIGLRAILVYEKYAWLVYFIIFMIIFGQTGSYADNTTPSELQGATLSGTVLSLLAIVYGSSASWATIASDYYVHYPADVSRTKVFLLTALGISIPTSIGMTAGAVVSSALDNPRHPVIAQMWTTAYDRGLGFLIQEMLYPRGFADFILVLLVLSGINMNILNTYSAAISCQQFARPFARVPRFLWTFLCFGVIIALALAGRNDLLSYLTNFLSLLGYWCTSYAIIVFCEHYIFRKGNFANYDLEGWNEPDVLPKGLAAGFAFAMGVVAWIMGMWQTWYTGPIASLIGETGGDVANEFCFVLTIVCYIPGRYLDLNSSRSRKLKSLSNRELRLLQSYTSTFDQSSSENSAPNTDHPQVILGTGKFGDSKTPTLEDVKTLIDLSHKHNGLRLDAAGTHPVEKFGRSEKLLPQYGAAASFTVDTKVVSIGGTKLHSRDNVLKSIEGSLKDLGFAGKESKGQFDITYLHALCLDTPLEETAGAMTEGFQRGWFERFGLSNYTPSQVEQICEVAKRNGWIKPAMYQGQYNPVGRAGEKDLILVLKSTASPSSRTRLFSGQNQAELEARSHGRCNKSHPIGQFFQSVHTKPQLFEAADRVHKTAMKHDFYTHEAALRWCLHHSALKKDLGDGIIVGASSSQQLEANLKACEARPLPDEVVKVIEEIWPLAEPVAPWAYIDAIPKSLADSLDAQKVII